MAGKKRQNRGRVNQSMGLKEMLKYRKRSVRASIESRKRNHDKLFSSIGSGSIGARVGQNLSNSMERTFEAPPISKRDLKKNIDTKRSIEDRTLKLADKLQTKNATTRNYSSIITNGGSLNNSIQTEKNLKNLNTTNNATLNAANVKLTPINKSNTTISNI